MHIFPCFFYRNFILLYIFLAPKASPSLRILSKPCESKLLLKCEVIHFFLLSHTLYVLRGAGTLKKISRFYCKLDFYKVLLMGKPRRKLDGRGGEVCQFPFLSSLELSTQQQWTDTGHCLMSSSGAYTVQPFLLGLSARKPCLSSTVQPAFKWYSSTSTKAYSVFSSDFHDDSNKTPLSKIPAKPKPPLLDSNTTHVVFTGIFLNSFNTNFALPQTYPPQN